MRFRQTLATRRDFRAWHLPQKNNVQKYMALHANLVYNYLIHIFKKESNYGKGKERT